jgi:DNA polymerase-1
VFARGRAWTGKAEQTLASKIRRMWGRDSIAFDYAVRCPGTPSDKAIDACRSYLRHSVGVLKPSRVLAFGKAAAKSIAGFAVPTMKVRRSWMKLADGTPVFFFPEPVFATHNRVLSGWLTEDIEWALAVNVDELGDPTGLDFDIIETQLDAMYAVAKLRESTSPPAFDVETFGVMGEPDFKIHSLAIGGSTGFWVWPEEALRPGDPALAPLLEFLRTEKTRAHNAKYEIRSLLSYYGVDIGPEAIDGDTMIWAKQNRADGSGALGDLSNTVGMGGHKRVIDDEISTKLKVLRALRRAADKEVPTMTETETRVTASGRKQRRKVVVESRPPNSQEREEQVMAAWSKPRTVKGVKTTHAMQAIPPQDWSAVELLTDSPAITPDWLAAALSRGSDRAYVYGLIDREICYRYNALDTVATVFIGDAYREAIDEIPEFRKVYDSHLGRAPWAVGWVEQWGMQIDEQKLADLEVLFTEKLREHLAEIHKVAPGINPGSSQQLGKLLYEDLKLPVLKKTATQNPSTDKTTLTALGEYHPVVAHVLAYKEVSKLNDAYARGLRRFIRSDGRIHCNLNITGTETGRLSCSSPNMQTIPSRGQYAKLVKSVFGSAPGYKLIQLDYKTLEMRVAAMLSQDPVMIQIFIDGEDPHTRTAEMVSEMLWGSPYGVEPPEGRTPEQKRRRDVCKWINFGTVYGQSPETLATMAGCTVPEAERGQEIVLGRFHVLKRWIADTERRALREGGTWTWWDGGRGRRRPIIDLGSSDPGTQGHGRRASYNTPVQGTGSEFCLASLVALVEWIHADGLDAKLVLTVHDSLIFECHEDDVDELVHQATRIMTGWNSAGVPLAVDVEIGDVWGDLKPWKA